MRTPDGGIRPAYRAFAGWLERTPADRIAQKREEAERAFHRVGITFAVYGEDSGTERLIPFDLVPRIISADEWKVLDRGLKQRVQALNAFLRDIYHEQAILKAGVVPSERVLANTQYRHEMQSGSMCPAGSTRTSPASTSFAPVPASSTFSRTTCACLRVCRTCSRTAR